MSPNEKAFSRTDLLESSFARTVAETRAKRGWSQDHLADEMRSRGVVEATQLTVSRLETGRRRPPLGEALVLADIFDMPLNVLAAPTSQEGGSDEDPASELLLAAMSDAYGRRASLMDAHANWIFTFQPLLKALLDARAAYDHIRETLASIPLDEQTAISASAQRLMTELGDLILDVASRLPARTDDQVLAMPIHDRTSATDAEFDRAVRALFEQEEIIPDELIDVDG